MKIETREMQVHDAFLIEKKLFEETAEYVEYFNAFHTVGALKSSVELAKKDVFKVIEFDNKVCGMYFLRGFDDGYNRPSFGVYVFSEYSGNGIAKHCVRDAIAYCKINNVHSLMLKVDEKNKHAKKIYESEGFVFDSLCPNNGQRIMTLKV